MELKQASIFGEYKQVVKKYNKNNKKSVPTKTKELKEKITILYNLYQLLYEKLNIDCLEQREIIIKQNIIIYPDEQQAEPIEITNMNILDDIDKRINKMKEILNV